MEFRQPTTLSRVMHQVLDQLGANRVLTLEFATAAEMERGLVALNEVATTRQRGVVVTPVHKFQIELRLADERAA